jgi:hypothetical protein
MFGRVIPLLSEWGKYVVVFILPIGRERERERESEGGGGLGKVHEP